MRCGQESSASATPISTTGPIPHHKRVADVEPVTQVGCVNLPSVHVGRVFCFLDGRSRSGHHCRPAIEPRGYQIGAERPTSPKCKWSSSMSPMSTGKPTGAATVSA